jgi:hypothetical protein
LRRNSAEKAITVLEKLNCYGSGALDRLIASLARHSERRWVESDPGFNPSLLHPD